MPDATSSGGNLSAGESDFSAEEVQTLLKASDGWLIHADVREHGFKVVLVDPLYHGLAGVDSSRLSQMGQRSKIIRPLVLLPA